jgi:hypothetical protein
MFMEQTNFSLIYIKENFGGFLSPDDVRLFYYDICFEKEVGNTFIYEWSEEIQSYLSSKNIIIDAIDNNVMPQSFEKNKIYFTMRLSDEGNKAVAFFRHLRNSFSHYLIGYDGNSFCMKDFVDENMTNQTMIGKIDRQYFYGLIDIFFKQKAKAEEEYSKYYTPDI